MLQILMLNYEFPPLGGGAATANRHLLKALQHHPNIYIDLITSSTGKAYEEAFSERIRIYYLNIGKKNRNPHYQSNRNLLSYTIKARKRAQKMILEKHYDCIHAFFGIPCGWIAQKLNLPYLVSLRGSDVPFYNRRFVLAERLLFRRLSRKIWRKAAYVVANSRDLKALAQKTAPRQTIWVIPNGVDTSRYYPDPGEKSIWKLTLLTVSRLIHRKGIADLLEALQGIVNTELLIAGEGNMRSELEQHATILGVNARFLGRVNQEELRKLYQRADAFVLPSHNEGMSNALLEAMASGLPVLVTDTGGSAELVKDNGYVVPVGDIRAFRERIKYWQTHPDTLPRQGEYSRRRAETMSWKRIATQYHTLYGKCVDKG